MKETLKQLDQFWFGYGSPVSLGLFRILSAGFIFINLLMIGLYFGDFFGETSYVPTWMASRAMDPRVEVLPGFMIPRLNPLVAVTDPKLLVAVYLLTMIAALLTTLGLWTRFSSILLAVLMVTWHHKNSLILHGGDTVMRMSAVYMALAPSGAAISLDRRIALKKGLADAIPPMVSLWPQRLIALNCALIYFTTTWAKWFGNLWKNGTATWYPARLNEFKRFPVPGFFNEFPMVYVTTYGTLAVEFALGVLVWFRPLRKWVLLSGLLLHAYIEYSMNIPLFAFVITSMYVAFYDGEEVAGWFDRLKAKFLKAPAEVTP